jgi:hypothetical protein
MGGELGILGRILGGTRLVEQPSAKTKINVELIKCL